MLRKMHDIVSKFDRSEKKIIFMVNFNHRRFYERFIISTTVVLSNNVLNGIIRPKKLEKFKIPKIGIFRAK